MNELKAIFRRLHRSAVFKNFSILTVSSLAVQIITVLTIMRIARHLLPEDFGKYSFIIALSSIYFTFSSFGARNVVIKAIAVKPELNDKIFYSSLIIRIIVLIFVITLIFSYNHLFSKIKLQESLVIILSFYVTFLTIWDSLESVSYGFQKMKLPSLLNLIAAGVIICCIFSLPVLYLTVFNILLITLIIQVLKTLIYWILLINSKLITTKYNFDFYFIKVFVLKSMPFFILSIFTLISTQLPLIYLEQNSTKEQIAYFNIANRIMSPMQLLIFALFSSFFPTLARLYKTDKLRFDKLVDSMFHAIVFSGIFFSLVLSLFSDSIVHILFGQSYISAAPVVSTQCWYTILFTIFCFIGTVLAAINKQKLLSFLSFFYACVSIPCLYLGSKYGAVGLSIGFVVTAILNMTYHIYWLQKSISYKWRVSEIVYLSLLFGTSILVSFYFLDKPLYVKLSLFPIIFTLGILLLLKYRSKWAFN